MIFSQSELPEDGLNLTRVNDNDVPALVENLEQGMIMLEGARNNILSEIYFSVKAIVFFTQPEKDYQVLSFTGDMMQTLIFINGKKDNSHVFIIDKLIHEAAHTYLFLINLHEEMVLNSREKIYASPLRSDKRDMFGIYHSTFVIQRLIFSFGNILIHSSNLTEPDHCAIRDLVNMYYQKLDQGYEVTKNTENYQSWLRT
ncbi:HEXXH motif-containing putative peptide modification protein [Acidithiobacillus ferrianus]|uniref:HEXXH motif domain-containing protein n=2 Tax=Acidithiobacillus ferrianus TaxID=2678518 RepID=A0A845UBW5_9PROT|nr:HEXXH motif-containing putative peptide modification protein [Acidithiobacillus ferrianus]NDU41404.1 hypothetical protein [Acidithiobacillus ferrianus]